MKVLVVSQYFWPENFRINDVVTELVRRGHDVTVLTGMPNYPEGQIYPAYQENPSDFSSYQGAQVVRVPLRPRGSGHLSLIRNYLSFVVWGLLLGPWRLRGRRFDVIFMFQTSPITAALPALLLRRIKRAPVLMWVLDLWPETLTAVGVIKAPLALKAVGQLVSFVYRRCDRILVQSRSFVDNVRHYAGEAAEILYFPGWAEDIFTNSEVVFEVAPEAGRFSETFNILFAGNIGDAQDFPSVLAAADELRRDSRLRWLIVGDGRAAAQLRNEIKRRALQDVVVLLGRHPIERMPSFFKAADALLVSLKKDPIFSMTIPGKVQSYLATGIPVLGMLDGEGARVIEEAGAGFTCAAGDSSGLAACVRRLIASSDDERLAMGERARAYCSREFDRSGAFDRLEQWMSDAAQHHVPPFAAPPAASDGAER